MRGVKLVAKNMVAQGLNTFIAIGFTIIGARLLSVADYGELRYVMTLLPLFMALSLPGYDSIILRTTSQRTFIPLARVFRERVLAGLIAAILILLGTFLLHHKLNDTLVFFLICAALLLPLFETATGYRNYLIGRGLREQSLQLLIQTRLTSLVMFASMCLIIYLGDFSRLFIFPAYLISTIVPTLLAFSSIAWRRSGMTVSERPQKGASSIVPAVTTTVAGLCYTFAFSLDRLWVHHELGAEQLAFYAMLIMVPQELARLFDATVPLFYRKLFFSKTKIDYKKLYPVFLGLPVLVAIYIGSFYELSDFVFGAAYTYHLGAVAISGLMILSQSFEYFNTHRIFARYGSQAQLLYSALNLTVSTLIIPVGLAFSGIIGVLAALIFKQLFLPVLYMFLCRLKPSTAE